MQGYNSASPRVGAVKGLVGKAMGDKPMPKPDPNKIQVKAHVRTKSGKSKGK